jgi:hypothetical protein
MTHNTLTLKYDNRNHKGFWKKKSITHKATKHIREWEEWALLETHKNTKLSTWWDKTTMIREVLQEKQNYDDDIQPPLIHAAFWSLPDRHIFELSV